jgi:hypothetical protein
LRTYSFCAWTFLSHRIDIISVGNLWPGRRSYNPELKHVQVVGSIAEQTLSHQSTAAISER